MSELDKLEGAIKSVEAVHEVKLYPFQKEILRKLLGHSKEFKLRGTLTGRFSGTEENKSNSPKEIK